MGCSLLLGLAVAIAGTEPVASITQAWPELRSSIRAEPPPPKITRGLHYVVSDEKRHDLFSDAIRDHGGIFVGVGTNQNYQMAALAKPELLVVIDFDQVVIDLHEIYRLVFLAAETPEQFLGLWGRKKETRQQIVEAITARFTDAKLRRRLLAVWAEYRKNVRWGLDQLRLRNKKLGVTTFLEDQAQYDVLRTLMREDRVLFLRGDFTGSTTFADLGRVARELNLPIRVLYLSNIEQYFGWSKGAFRNNMLGLPMDEQTVVLRAYGWGKRRSADGNYRYYVQSGTSFGTWLKDEATRSVVRLLKTEQATETLGYYQLELGPEAAPKPKGGSHPAPPPQAAADS